MGLLARLFGSGTAPRDLLADLAAAYAAEAGQASLLRADAERARYPQVAAALRTLAEVEDRHAAWIGERLAALGGQLPALAPADAGGMNQWQRAVAAQHRAHAKRRRLVELVAHWDPDEPEVVALLQRMEEEDRRQIAVYDGVIMRSDPQAID